MAIIVLTSATGAPGATTTALGLALTWPREVLLADCDRDPAQAVQAGWLAGGDVAGRGLAGLARAHREGRDLRAELAAQSVALTDGRPARRFLPGFTHPGTPALFTGVWPDLAASFAALADDGVDTIVDAGRFGPTGLPASLVAEADLVLMVTRTTLRSLAALRLHLPGLGDQLAAEAGHGEPGLLLVGEGMPYTAPEIAAQFGVPVLAGVPFDARAAEVLSDGRPAGGQFARSRLMRGLRAASGALAARLAQRRLLLEPTPGPGSFPVEEPA